MGKNFAHLVLVGKAMLSKSLIQFSANGGARVLFLYLDLKPNYGRGNSDLLQKDLCQHTMPPRTVAVKCP